MNTNYPNQKFKDYTRHDINNNIKAAQADGRIDLWAPPRSYVIFVPDTTQTLNHPPVLNRIPDQTAYTNSLFQYKTTASDANGPAMSYTLSNNPAWLSVTSDGILTGTPSAVQTGTWNVQLTASDPSGAFDADTFMVTSVLNRAPQITSATDTSAAATKRFERSLTASDADNDSLTFALLSRPAWLTVGTLTGKLSGTPAVADTGTSVVAVTANDGKGGRDTVSFLLTVKPTKDSVIATYRKPVIDGSVGVSNIDWDLSWRVAADGDTDSYWWSRVTGIVNNEMFGIYATWDSDSLYLGLDYYINDINNTAMLYVDAVKDSGRTDFLSTNGWLGDYPKNNRFRAADGIDLFVASYNKEKPSTFLVAGTQSINLTPKTNGVRGAANRGFEVAVSFNDIYGLGAGLVPKNASLKLVALASGGYDYGSGDAVPNNPDVNGDAGPDSLINLATVTIDKNGDGIPDPTVLITGIHPYKQPQATPVTFSLEQNYPNPFNPATTIRFSVADSKGNRTMLTIHDLLGRTVATLVNQPMASGSYSVSWNAEGYPSGLYIYTLRSGEYSLSRKLLLVK